VLSLLYPSGTRGSFSVPETADVAEAVPSRSGTSSKAAV
jgi:hypothetical protein